MKGHIVYIVPTFRNACTIHRTLTSIPDVTGYHKSIVVVDDGSDDGTDEIAATVTEHVLHHEVNCGVGAATRTGFGFIRESGFFDDADFVIKLDGDGQHRPDLAQSVVEELEMEADLVICSRFHPDSFQVNTPEDRLLLNGLFAQICTSITGWPITDARSGFMGMKFNHMQKLAGRIYVDKYGIPLNILIALWKLNPDADVRCIPHPALYGGETLTTEHRRRYLPGGETIEQKKQRFYDAWAAVVLVAQQLGIEIDCYKQLVDETIKQLCDSYRSCSFV